MFFEVIQVLLEITELKRTGDQVAIHSFQKYLLITFSVSQNVKGAGILQPTAVNQK